MQHKIFKQFFPENAHKKLKIKMVAALVGLILLLFMPVNFKHGQNLPFINLIDAHVNTYLMTSLQRAQDAYVITMALDSAIAVAKSIEIGANIPLFSGSVGAGELLSPLHAAVTTLSDIFTNIIILVMVEKQLASSITYICLKVFLPIILIVYLIATRFNSRCPWAKPLNLFLLKTVAFFWLIFPISAGFANYIDNALINSAYDNLTYKLKLELKEVFSIEEDINNIPIKQLAQQSMERLRLDLKDKKIKSITKLLQSISKLAPNPDNIISLLMVMLSNVLFLICAIQGMAIFIILFSFRIINKSKSNKHEVQND